MANQDNQKECEVQELLRQMATAVGEACFSAAMTAYEHARIDGLCHEGAWECALDAIRAVNFESVANRIISENKLP